MFSLFVSIQGFAFELDENTQNTETSAIEILTNAFSDVQTVNPTILESVELGKAEIGKPKEETAPKETASGSAEITAKIEKITNAKEMNFDPKSELGAINAPVGEVDNQASTTENKENAIAANPYVENLSNAKSLINKVGTIAKGPTNQLLNQVGLTPNLAKQVGPKLADIPKAKTEGGMFPEKESKSTFGLNSSDKTASFGAISKPTGQSSSEQLQKTLEELKKKEEEKKIAEKKDELGKNIKKFSDLKTPIAKEDYVELKKLFQDKENISMLNEMQELDPNFLNNTNEAYYGKEGEGDHGVRDNDELGKLPLLNFIDQFKSQLAANPEIFTQRNTPSKSSFVPHDRARNDDEAH